MTIIHWLRYACALPLAWLGIARFELVLAESQYERRGRGGDAGKAAYWARRAAAHGSLQAQRMLAAFYIAGFGIAKDWAEAARLYKAAADAGDPLGHHSFAWCCYHGVGVEKAPNLAFDHWLEAAKWGDGDAQAAVADCLFVGMGAAKDLAAAEDWARLAAKNGADGAPELLARIEAARSQ